MLISTKISVVLLLKEQWEYWKQVLEWYVQQFNISKELQNKISSIDISKHQVKIREILSHKKEWDIRGVENYLTNTYEDEFERIFFRDWLHKIRIGLMSFTEHDFLRVKEREKIIWDKEKITYKVNSEKLDEDERVLRNAIWINEIKQRLGQARESWDVQWVEQLELDATHAILREICKYPYQLTYRNAWFTPTWIQETKEVYCVWYSILWHAFLSELDIKHKALSIPRHSALEVSIWQNNYLFDATASSKLSKIDYENVDWDYKAISINGKIRGYWYASEVEWGLLSHIYNNIWCSLSSEGYYEEAIISCQRSIEISSYNTSAWNVLWNIYRDIGEHDQALNCYDKSIEICPFAASTFLHKWLAFHSKWEYKKAIGIYKVGIKINPKHARLHYNRWLSIYAEWNYLQAADAFKKALEIEPHIPNYYSFLGKTFSMRWNETLGVLYSLVSKVIAKKPYDFDWFSDEYRNNIEKLVKDKDFEQLRTYMLVLEDELSIF